MLSLPTQTAAIRAVMTRMVIVVLIALLTCSGSIHYYGYRQWRAQQRQLVAMASRLDQLMQQGSQQEQRLEQQLGQQLSQQLSQQGLKLQLEQQAHTLQSLQQMNTLQARQLQKLQQQILVIVGSHSQDWLLFEIHGLIRKAGHKLWLEQDLVTARRLLQSAESTLATFNIPALVPIRQALAEDNKRLAAVALTDDEGGMLPIMMLLEQIDPLASVATNQPERLPQELINTDSNTGEQRHWYHAVLHRGRKLLNSFITIQRYAGPIENTTHQEVGAYMTAQPAWCTASYCESLRAYLLLAAQAASRQQHEHYRQWLGSAVSFMQTHCDLRISSVKLLLEKIEQLRQHTSVVKIPQQIQSQRLLEDFLQHRIDDALLPTLHEPQVK